MAALRPSTRSRLGYGDTSKAVNGSGNNFVLGGPLTVKLTQEDQDKVDEERQREALLGLVQTWLERLQLISVITTFFASTEACLLEITIPSPTGHSSSIAGQMANIGLMCALIVHAHSAVISFLGAFFLIRYKLVVAEKQDIEIENRRPVINSPTLNDPEKSAISETHPIIWSTNPHLVQVGPFQREPPTELLARCHSLCIFLSFVGFVLALIGTICFAWDRLPLTVSVFASGAMGFCLIAGLLILIGPSTKISHIYHDRKSPLGTGTAKFFTTDHI